MFSYGVTKFNPTVIHGSCSRQVGIRPALIYDFYLEARFKNSPALADSEKALIKSFIFQIMIDHHRGVASTVI
jgi:hypothetical protein